MSRLVRHKDGSWSVSMEHPVRFNATGQLCIGERNTLLTRKCLMSLLAEGDDEYGKALVREIGRLQQSLEDRDAACQALSNTVHRLEDEIEELKSQRKAMADEGSEIVGELRAEKKRLEDENDRLRCEAALLNQSIKLMHSDMEGADRSIVSEQERRKGLEKQVQALAAKLESMNSARAAAFRILETMGDES